MAFKYPLNPYGGLMTFPVALAGGLVDSKAVPAAGDLQTLSNFVIFRNRFALRAPVTVTVQLLDDANGAGAAGNPITSVLALRYHNNFAYAIGYSSTTQKHYLYKLNPNCTSQGDHTYSSGAQQGPFGTSGIVLTPTNWAATATPAAPQMVSFTGGTATAPVARLFICDTLGQYPTLYETEPANVITITNLQDDFADTGVQTNSVYTYMFKYQYSMWGAGFFQNSVGRPEMLRFSQPGLIAATEPDIVNGVNPREFWAVDHREVGDRGDPFTCVSFAGGAAILFKRRQCYALFGYDADTWSIRPISDKVGCIGPYAATSTEDGMCFFWSDRGPHMTDGQYVYDIGPNIRKLVQAIGFNSLIGAEYSVDDSIVYFTVPSTGVGVPNSYLAYQRQPSGGNTPAPQQPTSVSQPGSPLGLWASGAWLNNAGNPLTTNMMAGVPNQTLQGPLNPPSNIAVVDNPTGANEDTTRTVTWTNGDTAQDTVTNIYRSLTGAFTPGPSNLVGTVLSGVSSFTDSGPLTQNTTYFYTVVHVRNNISNPTSGWVEPSGKTWLTPPTVQLTSLPGTGLQVSGTVTASDDVNIWRGVTANLNQAGLLTTLANPGASYSFNDTSGVCNTIYYYWVTASKTGATTSVFVGPVSGYACVTPPVITSASANVNAGIACGDNTVSIYWSGTNFHSFDTVNIYFKQDAGAFTLVQSGVSISQQNTQITLSVLNGSHTYSYKVVPVEFGVEYQGNSATTNTLSSNFSNCKL